jgi:hypothetical protein
LPTGDIFYQSDRGAVSLEMLQNFAKDRNALRAFEKEVNARTAAK